MTYLVYDIATSCAAPLGALWLAARPRYRPLLARFAPAAPRFGARPLWVQACSVGEVGTARPFIRAFQERHPEIPVLLTASTVAGYELAVVDMPNVSWFPFDHRWVVRRFVERVQPRALVLIETEIWPNVLRVTQEKGVPAVLLNGRLSDKHIGRYRRYRRLLRPVFKRIAAAGMQNAEYAERLAMLGTDPARIRVTGNTKFDGVKTEVPEARLRALRAEHGLGPEERVLVFGSTRPGDEALAAECWRSLRRDCPDLFLVVAPRHGNRLDEAMAPFDEPLLRRSEVCRGRQRGGERILVLDTVGELVDFYALAAVAVIGGSFYPGVNGHNPLEPAALGVPTVFGPFMRNFVDPALVLADARGARQVSGPEALLPVLRELLSSPEAAAAMAERGRCAVLANQGAIGRSLDLLDEAMGLDAGGRAAE
ncbi:MAG: 3-deoxy-D-manno-octulosonic acid transferase [Candidatus Hydrogenedentes bacterium]|nr:3-deoxy-D-manno-octulosonic acid transferase [Candidatus Hydrogenedentota bacterium]